MRVMPCILCEREHPPTGLEGPVVLDLSEFAHPDEVRRLLGAVQPLPAQVIPLLPPETNSPAWDIVTRGPLDVIALDRVGSSDQARTLERILSDKQPNARVAVRLRDGAALHHALDIASTFGGRLSAIWYAASDLLVDYRDDPGAMYFYDASFARLAASSWTRSRGLTIARALSVEYWGQLDLTFADPPAHAEITRARRLAAAEGFDAIIQATRALP